MAFAVGDHVQHADGEAVVYELVGDKAVIAFVDQVGHLTNSWLLKIVDHGDLTGLAAFADLSIGDGVNLYGAGGIIAAIDGATHEHTVEIVTRLTDDMSVTNEHVVPVWRLYLP
jgi:hypothetical protein